LTTKHIKRIGLNCSKVTIIFLFISCGNNSEITADDARINKVNTLRAKGSECNNIFYPKEHSLAKVDNCLDDKYSYSASVQIETKDILKSLDNDLDCIYLLGHYVQYISLENALINTCGNPPLNQ